jgi:hypothetical protein
MAAGIAFVVVFVFGTFASLGPEIMDHDTPASAAKQYVDYVSTSGHRTGLVIGGYALIIAGILFIWFTQGIRRWGGETIVGGFVGGLGVLGAGAMAAAGMTTALVAGAVEFGNLPGTSSNGGEAVRWVMSLSFPFLFVVFGLVAAATIGAIAIGGSRAGVLPKWLAYAAILAVLGGVFGTIFLPMVLPMLWFLALAIVGLRGAGAGSTPAPAPAP